MNTTLEIQAQDTPKIGFASVFAENLYAALQSVGTAIPNKPALPILANVALIAKNGTITVIASNLANTQVVKIGAKIDVPFEITLPWRTLRDILALASPERLNISVNLETSIAHIENGSWRCNLKGMPHADYPPIRTKDDATRLAIVEYEKLLELASIGKSHAASAKDNSRPVLQAAKIQITTDTLHYTSADGYTLFDATMAAETDESANYTALITAEMLYKALTSVKKNPRIQRGYISLYGTNIDETGRVNGMFFIEDSPLSTFESGIFPSIEFLDNSTPVGEIYEIHSVYKAAWGYRSAERLEFASTNESDVAETKMSFLSHDKHSGDEIRIDKWLPMKLDTYRFAILNGSTELAEYLRHASKNANCCHIAQTDKMVIFSHEYDGGTMRVAFVRHHTGTKIEKSHQTERESAKFAEIAEKKSPQTIEITAIRLNDSGFEWTGTRVLHYGLIEGEKCYTCEITGGKDKWRTLLQNFARQTLPKITIERPSYFTATDYWKNDGIGSIQQLTDAIERLAFSFGITDKMPQSIACEFLNTDESPDYAGIWQHIEIETIEEESPLEAENSELEYRAGLPLHGLIETIDGNIYEIVENEPQIIATDGENTVTIAYADIIALAISTESPPVGDSPTHEVENWLLDKYPYLDYTDGIE